MIREELKSAIIAFASGTEIPAEFAKEVAELTVADLAELRNENKKASVFCEKRAKAIKLAARNARADELLSMERIAMFREFIANPTYTYDKLDLDIKKDEWQAVKANGTLSFRELENRYQLKMSTETDANGKAIANRSVTIAVDPKWELFMCMFLDNLQLNNAKAFDQSTITLQEAGCGNDAKKKYGFEGIGKEKLKDQLRKVVSALIPEELVPAMDKSDVGYLLTACDTARKGNIKVLSEKNLTEEVFVTIRTRTNGGKYARGSKARIYRIPEEK